MSLEVTVRDERPLDRKSIRLVHRLAFGSEAEGLLVDRLRDDGECLVSLVAEYAGNVAGHVLFSKLPVEHAGSVIQAAALAPVAVRPELQGRGIGSRLITTGIERCRHDRLAAVLVLGNPDYYRRFGFSIELASTLDTRYAGPYYMGLELTAGTLAAGGVVRYPRAFELVE